MRLIALALLLAALPAGSALAADDQADPDHDAIVPKRVHTAVHASAGPSARMLFNSYLLGGEVEVGIGLDSKVGSYAIAVTVFSGVLEGGLFVLEASAGCDMAWPVGRARFGIAPRIGYLGIDRVTSERQFGAYTFGLAARASYDVFRNRGTAIALGLQPDVDVAAALGNDGIGADGAAPLWGTRAFFEVRYRAPL